MRELRLLGKEIEVGKTVLSLDIAKLHTRTSLEVPVIIERSAKEGPVLLLLAGIHGDEVNGVEIVRQIISQKLNRPKAGTVVCIPVVNVFGFLSQTREFPDGRDLNRTFPGSVNGSLASRFAHAIMTEIVPHIDYCIDFHTGSGKRFNYAQIRMDGSDKECLSLAKAFAAKFIIDAPIRDKSFRKSASDLGKKVLLFEGGKDLHLDKNVTRQALQGTMRVMQYLGIRDFSNELEDSPNQEEQIYIRKSSWIRANHSGMYRRVVSIGQKVEKGEVLGSISDPYGDFEKKVKSSHAGYIIGSNHSPIVNQGDALIHISTVHEEL
ncbi:MAG: succinylglutamate desuccinylase/aspartoacylase family protein [Cytophagales bacterium]|nr:succinylglutamate desuccinylase/aspartoacylase family protein [Cytophagales bacterium]